MIMKNKKNIVIGVIIALAVVIIGIIVVGSIGKDKFESNTKMETEQVTDNNIPSSSAPSSKDKESQEKVTPTFMYFISKNDIKYEETNQMIEQLKEKYSDKIVFDIIDIDEQPDTVENFPIVQGNTPTLIMLNTTNDISGIKFVCFDKEELETEIETALQD